MALAYEGLVPTWMMGLAYNGHVYMGSLALRLNDLTYISMAQMYAKSLKPQLAHF